MAPSNLTQQMKLYTVPTELATELSNSEIPSFLKWLDENVELYVTLRPILR